MQRLRLIAGREIAAYAGVPSFWVALIMGPVLMLLTGLAAGSAQKPAAAPPAWVVAVDAARPELRAAAAAALKDAGEIEGRAFAVTAPGQGSASTVLTVAADAAGAVDVQVKGEPLPKVSVALLRQQLAAAAREDRLRDAGASARLLAASQAPDVSIHQPPPAAPKPMDTARIGRFAVMMLLWMNLVGALGMLLQAVVRERSNRALESLLSAARPSEVIFGKLIGVGALSMIVLAAWLGAGAAIAASPMGGVGQGVAGMLLKAFADPASLLQAVVIYLMAFVMYGAALIGLGALARDVPAAQNLSRPVFGVLLLVFFVGLTQLTGAGQGLSWLAWIPPFTPFMVLMAEPGSIGAGPLAVAFASMALTTAVFGWLAARALTGQSLRLPKLRVAVRLAAA